MRGLILPLLFSFFNSYSSKIRIDVYYESFCPDSQKFITEQLDPAFDSGVMQRYFDVNLNSYGKPANGEPKKAKNETTGLYDFTCQHGPEECNGNFVHKCLTELLREFLGPVWEPAIQLPIVACLMKDGYRVEDPTDPRIILKCLKEERMEPFWKSIGVGNHKLDGLSRSVSNCARRVTTDADTNKFMAEWAEDTWDKVTPKITNVPLITFDDDQSLSTDAETNLLATLCQHFLKFEGVPECEGVNGD